jgi:hypothetical protein
MTRSRALKTARAAHRLANDSRTPADERAVAQRRFDELCKKYDLQPREIVDDAPHIVMLPICQWRTEETDLVAVVVRMAGGFLYRSLDGSAILAAQALDMPRVFDLTQRIVAVYRCEGERLDKAASNWRSFAFTSSTRFFEQAFFNQRQIGPDKASFFAGLTLRLIERLIPPPPPENTSCTAMVRSYIEPTATAAPNFIPQPKAVKSPNDFVAGVCAADKIDLLQRGQLDASKNQLPAAAAADDASAAAEPLSPTAPAAVRSAPRWPGV